ncbi:MAG: hypothetical protein ABSH09_10065 [Bryobacteraceae bacterium]|jgi:hypothetical protein
MTSADVREQILDSLILDLVGPVAGLKDGNHLEREILPESTAPLRWYLTGFFAPFVAKPEEKTDEDSGEQIDLIPPRTGLDDEAAPESASSRKTPFPSSMGLSVLIQPNQIVNVICGSQLYLVERIERPNRIASKIGASVLEVGYVYRLCASGNRQ